MSNKMTCPACGSHTSSIWEAVELYDSACPNCGMPAEMIREVARYRTKGADEELVQKLARLGQLAGRLAEENRRLREVLSGVQAEVSALDGIAASV